MQQPGGIRGGGEHCSVVLFLGSRGYVIVSPSIEVHDGTRRKKADIAGEWRAPRKKKQNTAARAAVGDEREMASFVRHATDG